MVKYVHSIKFLVRSEAAIKSLYLLSATGFGMVFLLGSNYFITRVLTTEEFGTYSLVLNVFNFAQVIFNFGLFHSFSRYIAVTESPLRIRAAYGAGVVGVLCLGILAAMSIILYAIFQKSQGQTDVYRIFLICAPFSFVFLMNNFNELLLQGSNKIRLLSLSRVMPRFLYFSVLFVSINVIGYSGSTLWFLTLFIVCQFLPFSFILLKIRPLLIGLRKLSVQMLRLNREFGLKVYIGSIVAVGASNLSGILINFFSEDNQEVGFYAIALQLSAPLVLLPNTLATVAFKKFANSDRISTNFIKATISISIISGVVVLVSSEWLIDFIYGAQYGGVVPFLYFSALGSVLYGIADFFNRFLLSKGKGEQLRNASFIVGGILLLSSVVFIKWLGGIGASVATVVAGFSYLLIIIYYYFRIIRDVSSPVEI